MTGQLVYPGAHLTLSGLSHTSVRGYLSCKVNSAEFMSSGGWRKLDEQQIDDHVFSIYQDNNQTFLQWLGTDDDRRKLQHRLILIRLRCEGVGRTGKAYEPCAALRIGWSPGLDSMKGGKVQKSNNYFIIGLCLGILGLIYVLALLVYLRIRQSKRLEREILAANLPISENTEDEESVVSSRENGQVSLYVGNGVARTSGVHNSNSHDSRKEMCNGNAHWRNGENGNNVVHGRTSRRRINLQPELFEPEMLASPPPPAQEFLQVVRGMIASARDRLRNFRFRPTLVVIPEDDYFYQDLKRQRNRQSRQNGHLPKVTNPTRVSGNGAINAETNINRPQSQQRRLRTKLKRAPQPPTGSPKNENFHLHATNSASENGRNNIATPEKNGSTKFDKFRSDLYEKLRNIYEGKQESIREVVLESPIEERTGEGCSYDAQLSEKSAKISRQQMLKRLEEETEEDAGNDEVFRKDNLIVEKHPCSESRPEGQSDTSAKFSEEIATKEQDEHQKYQSVPSPYDSLNLQKPEEPRVSCCELFGDQPTKNRCLIHDSKLTSQPQDDHVSESEYEEVSKPTESGPSLEEYLQLSDQVAKKLSERRVPDLECSRRPKSSPEKERNALSQFMKDFRETLGRLSGHFDSSRSKSTPPSSASSDNWTLKREDKKTRTRKSSGKKDIAREEEKKKEEPEQTLTETHYSEIEPPKDFPAATDSEMNSLSNFSESTSDQCRSTDSNLSDASVNTIIARPFVNGIPLRSEQDSLQSIVHGTLERHESFEEDSLQRPSKGHNWRSKFNDKVLKDKVERRLSEDSLNTYPSDCVSDITDDSLTMCSLTTSDNDVPMYDEDPVMACLNLLANTPLELVIGGRASKGLDVTQQFKTAKWNHICLDQVQKHLKNNQNKSINGTSLNLLNDYTSFLENNMTMKSPKSMLSSDWVATSTSEDEDTVLKSETSSGADCSSTEGDAQQRKKVFKKHVINGTCKQFIKNRQNGKVSNGRERSTNATTVRQKIPTSNGENSNEGAGEVTVIKLGDSNVTQVDSEDNFVTLIAVDSSEGSNDEEK